MKIVAGMGSIDDYERLVEAGADEVFCGFIPLSWNEKYYNLLPLNRREVLFYQVQAGTYEDMKILSNKVKVFQVPVTITLNALYYIKDQIEEILLMMEKLIEIGFDSYIIADVNLILQIQKRKLPCKIHVSGEIGEWNSNTVRFLNQETKVERIIFHRKNKLEDMKKCIDISDELSFSNTYEAFLLNEMCHFTGGFCNSLHCDEMVHLCQLPYRIYPELMNLKEDDELVEGIGMTGCGLCAMWRLKEAGVTHLKIVGRGKSAQDMALDIKAVVRARDILKECQSEDSFRQNMKNTLFCGKCTSKCYYLM